MNSNTDPIRDQAKAIREHVAERPAAPTETPREARYRVERERREAEAKRNPHRNY